MLFGPGVYTAGTQNNKKATHGNMISSEIHSYDLGFEYTAFCTFVKGLSRVLLFFRLLCYTVPMEDYYALLGVRRHATLSEIKRAYRKKAKKYHPDTAKGADAGLFMSIARAYEFLCDADRRALFDEAAVMRGAAAATGGGSFDYRAWLIDRGDEESFCKLVIFDLLHNREDDAVSEYVSLIPVGRDFRFARYFGREDSMDFTFILAEELILRAKYYEAALLLIDIVVMERRMNYFRAFFPEVMTLTRSVLLRKLPSVGDELALDAWERALEAGLGEALEGQILARMAQVYTRMGDPVAADRCYEEAARLGVSPSRVPGGSQKKEGVS
jgi:curved DNA-binding protein CbpA